MNATPESQVIKEEAKAAVASVNPTSPLVKSAWKTGTVLVSIAGILSFIGAVIPEVINTPEVAALIPLKTQLILGAISAACGNIGSWLAKRDGNQSAADVHAVRNLPPQ